MQNPLQNTFDLHYAIIDLENQLFVFFLSGCLRQVLLYIENTYKVKWLNVRHKNLPATYTQKLHSERPPYPSTADTDTSRVPRSALLHRQ